MGQVGAVRLDGVCIASRGLPIAGALKARSARFATVAGLVALATAAPPAAPSALAAVVGAFTLLDRRSGARGGVARIAHHRRQAAAGKQIGNGMRCQRIDAALLANVRMSIGVRSIGGRIAGRAALARLAAWRTRTALGALAARWCFVAALAALDRPRIGGASFCTAVRANRLAVAARLLGSGGRIALDALVAPAAAALVARFAIALG